MHACAFVGGAVCVVDWECAWFGVLSRCACAGKCAHILCACICAAYVYVCASVHEEQNASSGKTTTDEYGIVACGGLDVYIIGHRLIKHCHSGISKMHSSWPDVSALAPSGARTRH